MNPPATIATWEMLKEFGFTPDAEVISDEMPGLSCDFGNFKLSASAVLTIRCSGQAVPMPATGKAWSTPFEMPAGKLRRLPKRLLQDELEVSVYDGRLHIGRNCYGGVKEKAQVGAEARRAGGVEEVAVASGVFGRVVR